VRRKPFPNATFISQTPVSELRRCEKLTAMSNVQQAIREAAEKGGYRYRSWKVNDLEQSEGYNALQLRALSEHFHDPDFWKALATARRWEDANAWRFHWHRFIDHLADGKDAESFFATL
jgi:hypothetical protein